MERDERLLEYLREAPTGEWRTVELYNIGSKTLTLAVANGLIEREGSSRNPMKDRYRLFGELDLGDLWVE